jgi:hypothetical protein
MKRQFATRWPLGIALALLVTAVHAQNQADLLITDELIDQIMDLCRAGQSETARQMALDIQRQLPTTPSIDTLLAPVISGACQTPAPARLAELHLSLGWDNNINLGVSASSVNFQTATQTVNYQLDDSYRPTRSAFVSATGMHQHITASGWTIQTLAGARQLSSYSPFNTLGLQISGRRPLQIGAAAGHLSLGWAETWLGGQRYRSAPSLAWQSQPQQRQAGWSVQANMQQHHHHTPGIPDARLLQASLSYQIRPTPPTQISWGAGLLHDQALDARAGGNRQGHHLQARWQHSTPTGLWHAQWARHQWQSAKPFLPGLIDAQRHNDTTTLAIGYQRPLGQGQLAYLEFQSRHSRDSVPLYTHSSNQLSAGWLLRWP